MSATLALLGAFELAAALGGLLACLPAGPIAPLVGVMAGGALWHGALALVFWRISQRHRH
jgi:hypothetical protein